MEPEGSRIVNYQNIGKQSTTLVRPCTKDIKTQVAKKNTRMRAIRKKAKSKTS